MRVHGTHDAAAFAASTSDIARTCRLRAASRKTLARVAQGVRAGRRNMTHRVQGMHIDGLLEIREAEGLGHRCRKKLACTTYHITATFQFRN